MKLVFRCVTLGVALWVVVSASEARAPSLDERVAAQRAIEEVYWRHRIWPQENPGPKPPLSAVLSDEAIRARVEDSLRKSSALARIWNRPVTGRELQAELDRMSRRTRDPAVSASASSSSSSARGARWGGMAHRSSGKAGGPILPGSTASLRQFLPRGLVPEGTLSYHELQGFLFTIAAVPTMVAPSEWMPLVFGREQPTFDTAAQAKEVLGSIMLLYNEVNTDVFEHQGRLPEDCRFRDDVLSNLSEDAPISRWSRGFRHGHLWLRQSWDAHVPGKLGDELGAMILALSFFSSRSLAERCLTECTKVEISLLEMAETMRKVFPGAMAGYAHLGRSIHQALLKDQLQRVEEVGRNDRCPCGQEVQEVLWRQLLSALPAA